MLLVKLLYTRITYRKRYFISFIAGIIVPSGSMVLAGSMVFYNLLYYVCYCGILIPPVGLNMIPLERRLYTCSSEIFEDFDWNV